MLATELDALITYNPWTLSLSTTVAEAARLLDETGLSQWPIVSDEGALVGELTATALFAALEQEPTGEAPIDSFVDTTALPLGLGSGPSAALRQMLECGRRMLPVVEAGRVVGTLSRCDFLREVSYGGRAGRELVVDHLHKRVETIDADAALADALPLLSPEHPPLVVVQGDFPLGALSHFGAVQATVQHFARTLRGGKPAPRTLGAWLQACPSLPPGRTLSEAAALMVEHQLDALAIVNQAAHLLGVVTEEQILQAMLDM
jgi:CBS domain-containing protein